MEFIRLNVNPKQWKHEGDCVIRAIAQAEGLEWMEVYDMLCDIGRKICRMPNSQKTYERALKELGYIKYKTPRHYDNTKYTVKEHIDESGEGYIMVLSMRNHLSCSIENTLVDTWDCSDCKMGNYWAKPNTTNRKIIKIEESSRLKRRVLL